MGTRHFWPPTESTSLNRSLKNLAQVINSTTATAVQNLVEISSWGVSGQISEISRKFFLFIPLFSSNSPTGQTVHHIFTLNGSNDADSRKDVPFLAFVDIALHFEDQIAQKPQFLGVNRHYQAKRVKYWNVHIIKTTALIITKFCRVIVTTSTHCGWSKYAPNEFNMADGRHLEKSKKNLNIFATDCRFWQNLSCWCISTLWTLITNKISRFQKSKTAEAAILKIRKIAISPQRNDRFWRNLAQLFVWSLQTLSANNISQIWKSKMAAAAILKIWKIAISPQQKPILTKFGTVMRIAPPNTVSQ